MTWYEMIHKINTKFANTYLNTESEAKRAIIHKSQEELYEILKIETLARIATALEKLADCNIDIHSEDYIEE